MPRNRQTTATALARSARRRPSAAEDILWQQLRNARIGFKFRREHPIGPYRVDFYCHESLLCVEMDGEQHDRAYDELRDKELAKLGLLTYRIPNRVFFGIDKPDFKDHVEVIQRLCEERSGRKAFPAPVPDR